MTQDQTAPAAHLPSVPRYAPLQPYRLAATHLLVAQADALTGIATFIQQVSDLPGTAELVALGSTRTTDIPSQFCTSLDDLEQQIRSRLSTGKVGLRLYICGDEAFIWGIQRIARSFGMLPDEISATVSRALRAVYCVHCATSHTYDTSEEVACQGCQIRLAVRPHFSQRIGAYLGVCANADRPYPENHA